MIGVVVVVIGMGIETGRIMTRIVEKEEDPENEEEDPENEEEDPENEEEDPENEEEEEDPEVEEEEEEDPEVEEEEKKKKKKRELWVFSCCPQFYSPFLRRFLALPFSFP